MCAKTFSSHLDIISLILKCTSFSQGCSEMFSIFISNYKPDLITYNHIGKPYFCNALSVNVEMLIMHVPDDWKQHIIVWFLKQHDMHPSSLKLSILTRSQLLTGKKRSFSNVNVHSTLSSVYVIMFSKRWPKNIIYSSFTGVFLNTF